MYVELNDYATTPATDASKSKKVNCSRSPDTLCDDASSNSQLVSPQFLQSSLSAPWDAVCDLDKFLCGIYKYWVEGGFWAILAAHVSHVIALAFTIYFSWFLLVFVNWTGIVRCDSEESCRQVDVLVDSPFQRWGALQILSNVYFVVLNLFLIWNLLLSFFNCRDAWSIRSYFQQRLRIPSDEALTMLDWPEVVALLLKAQEESPFCIVEMNITVLDIVNIIMRQDNYLVAMTNRNLLTCAIPSWLPCRYVYSKPLFWNIRTALFMDMFDNRSRLLIHRYVRPASTHPNSAQPSSPAAVTLATRFRWMALLNLVFIVPTFLFIIIYFFLKHAEDFRANRSMPFKREFNRYAYWTFREINELPHQLERRLATASAYAEDYVDSGWSNPVVQRIKLCCKYITGAFLAVLLAIYVFDETPLLFVKLYDRNLLWYTIVFGFAYALMRDSSSSRGCGSGGGKGGLGEGGFASVGGPSSSITHLSPISMYQRCMRVVQYTHYLPPTWRRPATATDSHSLPELSALHKYVMDDFCSNFYIVRIFYLLEELLSVLVTPIALFFWMPYAADGMCDFVAHCTYRSTVGDHCAFALFDLRANGSAFYNASVEINANPEFPGGNTLGEIRQKCRETVNFGLYSPMIDDEVVEDEDGGCCSQLLIRSTSPGNCRLINQCKLKSYSGKLEKSLLTYVLYYRLPTPYDDSSPMWAVFTTEEMLASIRSPLAASAISEVYNRSFVPPCVLSRAGQHSYGVGSCDNGRDYLGGKHHVGGDPESAPCTAGAVATEVVNMNKLEESISSCYVSGSYYDNERSRYGPCASSFPQQQFDSDDVQQGDAASTLFGTHRPWKKWGYNEEALRFVERLENFQAEHLKSHPFLRQELPPDLCADLKSLSATPTTLDSIPEPDGNGNPRGLCSATVTSCMQSFIGPPPLNEEMQAAYFFWLEKFYEIKSGRIFYPTNQLNHYFSYSPPGAVLQGVQQKHANVSS